MELRYEFQGDDVLRRVGDIPDLTAAEINYHEGCRSAYVSSVNLSKISDIDLSSNIESNTIYDTCFKKSLTRSTIKL